MKAFIAGTDTGVGKTFFAALLTRALRASGLDTVALKPVCCGDRDDARILWEACEGVLSLDEINPIWLSDPLAPLQAARQTGQMITREELVSWFQKVSVGRQSVLVEGAGGWAVPVAPGLSMADLAVSFNLPVVVVVPNRLGCLNHTLLTVAAIRSTGLPTIGLVLNSSFSKDPSTVSNRALLEELTGLPILFELTPSQSELVLDVA
ncbi:MAG: dethiobiotin synthase [Terrimicrobiaceae bacterium]